MPVQIMVSGLSPRPDMFALCLGSTCEKLAPLAPTDQMLLLGPEVYDQSTVTLRTSVGGQPIASYRIDGLTLRRPSGKGCDCGEVATLVPTADGRLVRR
jgi:hypothetical protein